jgi:hypothetical protein
MEKLLNKGPFLNHLRAIELKSKNTELTLKDIFETFGPDGHSILILFLILPFLQPVPLFGLSSIFGVLIAIIGAFAYAKKPPWLPQSWGRKKISTQTISMIVTGAERIFNKMSFLIHARWQFLFQAPFRQMSVLLLIFNAILIALPLPIPFSNTIPAWVILFQALAFLEEDGLLIIISYLLSVLCAVYFFYLFKGLDAGIKFFM